MDGGGGLFARSIGPWYEHPAPVVVVEEDLLTPPWPSGQYVTLLPRCCLTLKATELVQAAIDNRWGFFVANGKAVGCLAELVGTFTRNGIASVEFRGVERALLMDGPSEDNGWRLVGPLMEQTPDPSLVHEEMAQLRRAIARVVRKLESPMLRRMWREISRLDDPGEMVLATAELAAHTSEERQDYLEADSLLGRFRVCQRILVCYIVAITPPKEREPDGGQSPPALKHHRTADLLIWSRLLRGAEHGVGSSHTTRDNPLVHMGTLYVSTSNGGIRAINLGSRKTMWRREIPGYPKEPTLVDGVLLVCSTHTLWGLDPTKGRIVWRFCPWGDKHEWIYSSPVVSSGRIYLGDRKGFLHCLDFKNGGVIWSQKLSTAHVNGTALVLGDRVVCSCNAGQAHCVIATTGEKVWQTDLDGPSIWEVSSFDGGILVKTSESSYQLNRSTGSVTHRWHWPGWTLQSMCQADDRLIFHQRSNDDDSDEPRVVAIRNGKEDWTRPGCRFTQDLRWSSATGLVYESRIDGFSALSPASGERLWSIDHIFVSASPTVQDGAIYLVDHDGKLFVLKHPGPPDN